ncbi:TonB-dependent receptor [bacterium]|nr:TonB-dependent receptor [bacterium]
MNRQIHRSAVVLFLALILPVLCYGQQDMTLSNIIYSVNRTPELTFETARSIKVITSEDIWRKNARTLPEVLMEEAGIFVQQTSYGSGSPIIRGLIGKEILIFMDGVKVNTATYRYGPIQYLNTIDLNMVERIEIVKGVESVLASFALGGVINIITKKGPPENQEKNPGGEVFSRYSSADKGITEHAELYGVSKKYRYFLGASYRKCDDVKGGGDIGTQAWTGYDEYAGNLNLDYFINEEKTLSLSYYRLEENDVPRTDKFGSDLLHNYEPQRIQLGTLTYQDQLQKSWMEYYQVRLSWNKQEEGLDRITSDKPDVKRFYSDDQTALGLNIEMVSFPHARHRFIYGFDMFTESINSSREDVTMSTGASKMKRGTWTDGATYKVMAVYFQDRFSPMTWLSVSGGLRYVYYQIGGSESSSLGELDLDGSGGDLTGSLNTVFHVSKKLNFIVNAARSFRSPNIDDVSVYDERSDGVEVPNPDIESVSMFTYETGLKYETGLVSGSAFYYHNSLDNLMERSAGTLRGLAFFDNNDNGIQDEGEPDILQRQNIGEAMIQGIELDVKCQPHRCLTLFGNYTWTKGEDKLLDEPLSRIPPAFGALSARWMKPSNLQPWMQLTWHFAGAQTRVSTRDAGDNRIGPDGTDGFSVITLRGGLSIARRLRVVLGLENLTDEAYKYHASGVYRPGFQVTGAVEIRL